MGRCCLTACPQSREPAPDAPLLHHRRHHDQPRGDRHDDGGARRSRTSVSSRTLSTDHDGRQAAWAPEARLSNGYGSFVSRDMGSSDPVDLTRLLGDARPVATWQSSLGDLLRMYINVDDARQALSFLIQNMTTAIKAIEDPAHSVGHPSLYIDIQHKPVVFNIDLWKNILLPFKFDLTEPEGNQELDLIEVQVTEQISLASLVGFEVLLRSLKELSSDMLRMVLYLQSEEGLGLLAAVQDVCSGCQPQEPDVVRTLYVRYKDQLSALGFKVDQRKHVTWHPAQPQPPNLIHLTEVSLIGLFHDGSGLETYI